MYRWIYYIILYGIVYSIPFIYCKVIYIEVSVLFTVIYNSLDFIEK